MPDVVISEFMDTAAVDRLSARFETLYDPGLVDRPDALAAAAAGARALVVRNRTEVRGALLASAGRLEVVGRLGVGLDNIDVAACEARGIRVVPATGANTDSVAEYVIAATLMLLRGAYLSTAEVAAGRWPRQALGEGREAAGRRIGLVGFGGIGMRIAGLARAIGLVPLAYDPIAPADDPRWSAAERCADLAGLLAASDVVSLHVPLTDATRNLIDAAAIGRMKPGAILINTARGGVVDEAALADALRSGRLGGAALDVFAREPLDAAAGAVFAGCPNLLLTPHVAGVTADSNTRVSDLIATRVIDLLEGR